MNLRSRIILSFSAFLALELFFFYGLYKWELSPKIYRVEERIAERNLSRNMELLQRELFHLERTGWLLSSLQLIQQIVNNTASPKTVSTDPLQAIMLQQDLNLLYIIDDNNEVVFGKIIDLDSMMSYPNEKFLPSLWKEKPSFIKPASTPNSQMGIYNSLFGPVLIVSIPIHANGNASNIVGRLIIGKLLTPDMIHLLRKISFSTLSIWPLEGSTLSKRHAELLNALQHTDANLLITASNNVIQAYTSLADINQVNSLLLSVSDEREFRELILLNLLPACVVFILLQLLFIGLLYWMISKRANTPIRALIEQLDSVHDSAFSMTFSNRFWGELEPLVQSLSRFITAMEQRITKKNTLAYQQGLYFADQSLLQDAEQILPPLIDGLAHLENEWLSLPTDDLEWILAEYKARKPEQITEEFQKDCLRKLSETYVKLSEIQKNAHHYTLELHHDALRSTLLLRRHANHLSPNQTRS